MEYKPRDVPDDELETSFTVPTAFVNTFLLNEIGGGGVRIAFGERRVPNAPAHYRIALGMNREQAYELKLILDALLKPYEKEIEEGLARRVAELKNGEPT